jgi:phosphoribosyl 1,2-cyclic phosphodiesterase
MRRRPGRSGCRRGGSGRRCSTGGASRWLGGRSTSVEAAELAKRAKAKRLALTHFSARYRSVSALVKQAREVFPEAFAASDGMFVEVPAKAQ